MTASLLIAITLYIFGCASFIVWLISSQYIKLLGMFFGEGISKRELILTIAATIAFILISSTLPKIFEDYSIVGFTLGFGILPYLSWREKTQRRSSLGRVLFTSEFKPPIRYINFLFIPLFVWLLHQFWVELSGVSLSSTKMYGDAELNTYIWVACRVIAVLSMTIFFLFSQRIKLEIRDRGIWFLSNAIPWEKIKNFAWSEKQPNLLEIITVKEFRKKNKEVTNKYRVLPAEKETVAKILQEKLVTDG